MNLRTRALVFIAAAGALGAALLLRAGTRAHPAVEPSASASSAAAPPAASATAPPAPSSAPSAAVEVSPEVTSIAGEDRFKLLVFLVHLPGARLRVVDLGMGRDLARVLRETTASLVVNGGFFDRAERAEGLVVSEGAALSAWSEPLGGGVVVIGGGRASLLDAKGFVLPAGTDFAIQARPRLVVDGKPNIGRDDGRAAERTALCVREHGRALEVVVARGEAAGQGPTLALLAEMLASRGCEGALNLDGGPSTGVAWREASDVHEIAPRGPVRHAVAIWAPAGGE
ncbi:MAG: phosphodiester glycosidase family protein [Byssovorax sp.]